MNTAVADGQTMALSLEIRGVFDGVCVYVDHEGNMTNRFDKKDTVQWKAVEEWLDKFYPDRRYWPIGMQAGWKGSNPVNQKDEE